MIRPVSDDALPLGPAVDFRGARVPAAGVALRGTHVELRPVDPDLDADHLFSVSHAPSGDPAIWTYLFEGPFTDVEQMRSLCLERMRSSLDPLFFAVVPLPLGRPCGICAYLRITPEHGVIEIGNIWFGAPLQRSTAATEAIYLLARHAFDELGYRRLEWKCNALNAASRRAAQRFGFKFEGVFEQHMVIKGRNRDTAWFAITDRRWPFVRAGFQEWLDPANFDADGRQLRSLGSLVSGVP